MGAAEFGGFVCTSQSPIPQRRPDKGRWPEGTHPGMSAVRGRGIRSDRCATVRPAPSRLPSTHGAPSASSPRRRRRSAPLPPTPGPRPRRPRPSARCPANLWVRRPPPVRSARRPGAPGRRPVLISSDTGPGEICKYAVYCGADQRRDPPLTYTATGSPASITRRGATMPRGRSAPGRTR